MAKKFYKDTAANRKLGRVGKEISSANKAEKPKVKKTDSDPKYDKKGRKDRSRVVSNKYVDEEDIKLDSMPRKFPNKKAPKKEMKKAAPPPPPKKKDPKKEHLKNIRKGAAYGKNHLDRLNKLGKTPMKKVKKKAVVKPAIKKKAVVKPAIKKKVAKKAGLPLVKKKTDILKAIEIVDGEEYGFGADKKKKKAPAKKKPTRPTYAPPPPPKPPTKEKAKETGKRVYKDTAANRKLGRVGKEIAKKGAKKDTHKMPNGDTHTGKSHTKDSKLVKKKGDSDKKYNDEYSKQLLKKKKLQEVVRRTGGKIRSNIDKKGKVEKGRKVLDRLRKGKKKRNDKRDKKLDDSYKNLFSSDEDEVEKPKNKPKPKKKEPYKRKIPIKRPPPALKKKTDYTKNLDKMIEDKYEQHKSKKPTKPKQKNATQPLPDNSSYIPPNVAMNIGPMKEPPTRKVSFGTLNDGPQAYGAAKRDNAFIQSIRGMSNRYLGAEGPRGAVGSTSQYEPEFNPINEGNRLDDLLLGYREVPYDLVLPPKPTIDELNPGSKNIPQRFRGTPYKKPAITESIGGGIKKEVKVLGGPAKQTGAGYFGPDNKPSVIGHDKEDYSRETDEDFDMQRFVGEGRNRLLPSTFTDSGSGQTAIPRQPSRGAGFIKNTRTTYAQKEGKKGLYKDRKADLLKKTIGTENEQVRPVRNPRFFKGNKRGDAEFIRPTEVVDQVRGGVKTRTKDAGDGILPKTDKKIPAKPRQPKTNKAFLAGRKLKDLSPIDKKEYEKVKKANQRYNKKIAEWTDKYGKIRPKELKVPASSASLIKGGQRVIDKYNQKGTPVKYGGEGIESITKESTYKKGGIRKALDKLGAKSSQDVSGNIKKDKLKKGKKDLLASIRAKGRGGKKGDTAAINKKKERKAANLEGYAERGEEALLKAKESRGEVLFKNQLRDRTKGAPLVPPSKQKLRPIQDRILKESAKIGKVSIPNTIPIGLESITKSRATVLLEQQQMNADFLQQSLETKGENDRKYQKIRQSDTEFNRRAGQQAAVEIIERGQPNPAQFKDGITQLTKSQSKRAIGVQSSQSADARLAKITKAGFNFSNTGSKAKQLSTGDTRYFDNGVDWETGQAVTLGAMGNDDGLGDSSYQ